MRDRVLFLSANMGTGHSSAAGAILRALQMQDSAVEGRIVNSFQYASQLMGRMVEDGYIQMLKSFPTLYGLLYERRDSPSTVGGVRRWLNHLFAPNFVNLLESFRPHAVVCTHAFPFGVMSAIREKFGLDVPCIGVVTDFVVHPYWVYENMDTYTVAVPELAAQLVGRGVPQSQVHVTGIPIDPRFTERASSGVLRERLSVNSGLPVVLVMGGGLGMGPVGKILRSLKRIERPMHVVVLTGQNDKLKSRLEQELARLPGLSAQVQVLGYVDNVHEYMQAADLLVTKPGGLTTAEALASALPMVIVHPLPGQEMRNTRWLLGKKVAVRVANERSLHRAIEDLLDAPDALRRMATVSGRLARPEAAFRIASLIRGLPAGPPPVLEPEDRVICAKDG